MHGDFKGYPQLDFMISRDASLSDRYICLITAVFPISGGYKRYQSTSYLTEVTSRGHLLTDISLAIGHLSQVRCYIFYSTWHVAYTDESQKFKTVVCSWKYLKLWYYWKKNIRKLTSNCVYLIAWGECIVWFSWKSNVFFVIILVLHKKILHIFFL